MIDNDLLRKVQLTELEIAKEIKRICEKYNIQYFIDFGTLLGAARHKGFIPWDDDMDIGFTRENYDKFLAIAEKELSDQYILQTWFNDDSYGYSFAKVRKKDTIFLEMNLPKNSKNVGVFVDLFPYDFLPKKESDQKRLFFRLTILKTLIKAKAKYRPWIEIKGINYKKWFMYLPIRILSIFFKKENLQIRYENIIKKTNLLSEDLLYHQRAEKFNHVFMKKNYFLKLKSIVFEDTTFLAPELYHEVLQDKFGNYMMLPPEEERENGHGIIKIDLGK